MEDPPAGAQEEQAHAEKSSVSSHEGESAISAAAAAAPDVVLPGASTPPPQPLARPPGSAGSAGKASAQASASKTSLFSAPDIEETVGGQDHVDTPVMSYVDQVAQLIAKTSGAKDKLEKWYGSKGLTCCMPEHVESVYAASGITDLEGRARLVHLAVERQQQLLLERRSKKKLREKLREAAGFPQEEEAAVSSTALPALAAADAASLGPYGMEQPLESGWSRVRDFKTIDEAMHFVIECQPIDYRPLSCFLGSEGFPKFETTQKAYQHVMQMEPVPHEFVSVESKFCRRMRVRRLADDELKEARANSSHAIQRKRKSVGGLKAARGARLLETVLAAQELKTFVVESAGDLFERPPSLRSLNNHAANARFFIAVSPEIEKKVLLEGYRVRRRCSIPLSATPKEARDAFRRESGEKQAGRPTSPRVSVLAVSIPPELHIKVVAHKAGGFLIRTKELPPACFARLRRPGAGGEST